MEIDMLNGEHIGFTSHLFTSTELDGLFRPHLRQASLVGLDVFHSRFATNRRWNPAASRARRNWYSMEQLEQRYACDPPVRRPGRAYSARRRALGEKGSTTFCEQKVAKKFVMLGHGLCLRQRP